MVARPSADRDAPSGHLDQAGPKVGHMSESARVNRSGGLAAVAGGDCSAGSPRRFAAWFGGYAACSAVHLATHLRADSGEPPFLQNVSQWLLMPLLGGALWSARPAPRDRIVTLGLIALGFSFLGDALPDAVSGDNSFLVLVGSFLLAQVAYIVAFWPRRERSLAGQRSRWMLAYVAGYVALVAYCAPKAGALVIPVVVYGACLTAMAILATGLGTVGTVGGLLFFGSDAMIALDAFRPDSVIPHSGFAFMATYIAAQALLMLAIMHDSASPETPAGSAQS